MSVFVGVQPVFTHVPPKSFRSTKATVMPASVRRWASAGPAWPAPMMIASNSLIVSIPTFLRMTASSRRKKFVHVTIGRRRCFFWRAAVLTSAQVRRVPVPPLVFTVRLFKVVVVLSRLVQEICESCDVTGSCCRLPFASRNPHRDLLQEPIVSIRIFERGKREVRTVLRVAPGDARVLHCVVEWTSREVEDLAHIDAAANKVAARGVDVVHCKHKLCRAVFGRSDSLAEDDRGVRVVRRHLHAAEVAARNVDVEPPAEFLVESFCAVDVGNAQKHDLQLHVRLYFIQFSHLFVLLCDALHKK